MSVPPQAAGVARAWSVPAHAVGASSRVLATRLLTHWRKAKYLGSITSPPSSLSEVAEGRHAPETFQGLEEAHTRVPGSRQADGNRCQDPLNCTSPSLLWKSLRVYQAH